MNFTCTATIDDEQYTQVTPFPQNFHNKWATETHHRATFSFWCEEIADTFHQIPVNDQTFRQWAQCHLWMTDYNQTFDDLHCPKQPTASSYHWRLLEQLILLSDTYRDSAVSEEGILNLIVQNERWLVQAGNS